MQIQINTGHNIDMPESLATHCRDIVTNSLSRFTDQVTRVEVHLSDENGDKSGQFDKRCMIEARLEGRQPTAVTHDAASLDDAIGGAAEKLKRSIESTLGRIHDAARKS